MSTETCQIVADADDSSIYHLKIASGKLSVIIYQFFFEGIPTDSLQKFVKTSGAKETQLGDDLSHQVNLVPKDDEVGIETVNHGPGPWATITVSKEALLPALKDLLSRLNTSETVISDEKHMLKRTVPKMSEIVKFICEKRKEKLTDPQIDEMVREKFYDYCFTFGDCAIMDLQLGKKCTGGYWRAAYDWPTKESEKYTVTDCGFFTFYM